MSKNEMRRAPRSTVVPYIEGESASKRHERRRLAAERMVADLRTWCDERGIALIIRNQGEHYKFARGSSVVEWWPSSGRVVYDRRWSKARKAHDAVQVRRLVEGALADAVGRAPRAQAFSRSQRAAMRLACERMWAILSRDRIEPMGGDVPAAIIDEVLAGGAR